MTRRRFYHPKRWTEAIALRMTLARVRKMDALLCEIGGLWGDVDQYIVDCCDQLRRDLDTLKTDIVVQAQDRAEAQSS